MRDSYKALPSFTLVLHGWNERLPFETLLPLIERYFARAGVEPQIGSVMGVSPHQIKTYSMRTIRKRIQSQSISRLHTLSAYHLTNKEDKQSHDFGIGFDDSYGDQDAYIVNAVNTASAGRAMALDFLRDMLAFVSPNYGYSLELPLAMILYCFRKACSRGPTTRTWKQRRGNVHPNWVSVSISAGSSDTSSRSTFCRHRI
jgi:hypothetical protein